MSTALEQLAGVVRQESGIVVVKDKFRSLETAAARAAPGLGTRALLDALDDGPRGGELLRRLIDEVTVNETFFFRHAADLLALDWPSMLDRARSLGAPTVRVWVAGCATGEEAYTLAMLASEAFGAETAPVSIVASDISTAALAAARRGVYGPRAIRGIAPGLSRRYLVPDGKDMAVTAPVRGMVRYVRHNLVRNAPPTPGSFDLITCRNVLIYFDPDTAQGVVDSLRSALSPGGRLLLGAADLISLPLRRPSPGRIGGRVGRSANTTGRPRNAAKARNRPAASQPTGHPVQPAPDDANGAVIVSGLASGPATASTLGISAALAAADAGRLTTAIDLISDVLAVDPLNADAHYVRGLAELSAGDAPAAAASLRRALYVRPDFALAAFKLGRALEAGGEHVAAGQAYRQALHTVGRPAVGSAIALDPVATADVMAACRLRLGGLGIAPGTPWGRKAPGGFAP